MTQSTATERRDAPELDDRFRPELLAHCYRMLGSIHDAEDLVQETYLRAWRSLDRFEERSSMRTWLYRIATNACLTALEQKSRRPMPSGLGAEPSDPAAELASSPEVPWLEPVPDAMVRAESTDPANVAGRRESIRLAFVAALQHLPPRQRAVLILRDVLAWRAAEVAELFETSTAAVNSSLQRARAQLQSASVTEETVDEHVSEEQQELLDRYVAAFERYDVAGIAALFTEEAVWEMPPFSGWFQGGDAISTLVSTHCPASGPGDMRMVPIRANGQPGFALYMRDEAGVHRAFQLHVLTLGDGAVTHASCFFDTALFATFGLPDVLG